MYRLQLSTLWEESLKAVVLYLRQRVVNNDICFVFNVLGLQDEAMFWAMIFCYYDILNNNILWARLYCVNGF